MDRARWFDALLRDMSSAHADRDRLLAGLRALSVASEDPFVIGALGFVEYWLLDFGSLPGTAAAALARAEDPEARALACAIAGLAAAAEPSARLRDPRTGGDPLEAALGELAALPSTPFCMALIALLAESALACARLELALRFHDALPEDFPAALINGAADQLNPFIALLWSTRLRLFAFHGRVDQADRLPLLPLDRLPGAVPAMLVAATRCLVHGAAARRREVTALVRSVAATAIDPAADRMASGCFLLLAYGMLQAGRPRQAAELIRRAGGGDALLRLPIIDRVLGIELLVQQDLADGRPAEAQRRLDGLAPLIDHPIAAPTVCRITALLELDRGAAASAVRWAERAIGLAVADGRAVEQAQAELLLARAKVALAQRGAASATLTALSRRAQESGHRSARLAANRVLKAIGRRGMPIPGSGWEGLSARERDVALLAAQGRSNAQIAAALFISRDTVQMHMRRVLAAFGLRSRTALAGQLVGRVPGPEPVAGRVRGADAYLPPLTPRQRQVLAELVAGRSNAEIAAVLGISARTVEKHLGDAARSWGAGSRHELAAMSVGLRS